MVPCFAEIKKKYLDFDRKPWRRFDQFFYMYMYVHVKYISFVLYACMCDGWVLLTSSLNFFNGILDNHWDLGALHLHQCGQLHPIHCEGGGGGGGRGGGGGGGGRGGGGEGERGRGGEGGGGRG